MAPPAALETARAPAAAEPAGGLVAVGVDLTGVELLALVGIA